MTAIAVISADETTISSSSEFSFGSREPEPRAPRYEIIGPRTAPVVVVLGGISASRHAASSSSDPSPGWWEDVVGPGRAIDTRQFRILSIDYVSHESSAPPVTTADQAEVLAAALDHVGVRSVHAVVGASYGGMVALAFGAKFPARAKRLIVISAAHESDPIATALRHLQRRVVALGSAVGRDRDGLAIARGIAMTSYLTARHFEERIACSERSDARLVEDRIGNYLKTRGEQFADQWTPDRYNALSLSLDLHQIRPEDVTVPTTVIAVSGDRLVPVAQCRELARRLGGSSQILELDSSYGHDAFLGDSARIAPFVNELLRLGLETQS